MPKYSGRAGMDQSHNTTSVQEGDIMKILLNIAGILLLHTSLLGLPPEMSLQKKPTASSSQRASGTKSSAKKDVCTESAMSHEQQIEQLEQDYKLDLPPAKVAKAQYKQQAKEPKQIIKTDGSKKQPFWKTVTISDMEYDELLARFKELVAVGDYTIALKYIEHLFKRAQNPAQTIYIMLEWGALLMRVDDYARAETMFRDFIKLYPSNKYAQHAFVRAIECSWYQTTTHERDQTKTEETLRLIEEFFTRQDVYTQANIDHISNIRQQCYVKLATSNMHIARQYINLSRYRSAHNRIEDIKAVDLIRLPDIEPELLQIELMLAQAERNSDIEKQIQAQLTTKFPTHEITLALTSPKKSWFMGLFA